MGQLYRPRIVLLASPVPGLRAADRPNHPRSCKSEKGRLTELIELQNRRLLQVFNYWALETANRPIQFPARGGTWKSYADLQRYLYEVFRAIAANKLRSFLTMFGIAWGVGSLLVLVGLGEGFRSGQRRNLARLRKRRGDDVERDHPRCCQPAHGNAPLPADAG